jgi:hypothetical protein
LPRLGVDLLAAALAALGPDAEVVIVEGAIDYLARRRIARHRDERPAVIGVYSASSPCVMREIACRLTAIVVLPAFVAVAARPVGFAVSDRAHARD